MTLSVELVDRFEGFSALAPEWNAALDSSAHGSIFLTHEWLSAAWSFVGQRRSLFVLLLRDGGRLVGALPLSIDIRSWRGLSVRSLCLLTDPITTCVRSDCFIDGSPADAVAALGDFLRRHRGQWDVADFDSLPEGGCLADHFDLFAAAIGGPPAHPSPYWRLQYVEVTGNWDDYLARLGANGRERLRRESRRLERAGRIAFEFATEPAQVQAALAGFFDLEKRSKKQRKESYTPLDDRLLAYYRLQFAGLAASGRAMIASLRIDDELAASITCARFGSTLTTLNDMFDSRFAKITPGHLLRGAIVRHCWENGYTRIDFNGHGHHFERWLTSGLTCVRPLIYSPSAFGRLLRFGHERLLPGLRACLPWGRRSGRTVESPANRGFDTAAEGS